MYGFTPLSDEPISDIAVFTPAANTLYYSYGSGTLPTDSNPGSVAFSSADYTSAATADSVFVHLPTGGANRWFVFQRTNANNTDAINITWSGKSNIASSTTTVYLQIYNYNTTTWDALANNAATAANTNMTITGAKSTSLSNYYGGGNLITCRVYQ